MSLIQDIATDEMALIEELKRRYINEITPKMREDDTLWHRFLKARDFNLKDAEDLLKKHIQFRKEFRIDHILEEWQPCEVLAKYCPMKNIGFDKEGHPIVYIDMAADTKGRLYALQI
ncbi:SEC14-like protein 3 like protein [Argiope bruennichi]|uniref:SEC14-like protein 3 like protein n=1 Tax=Argiope bruennichi TaxID=94029 RepID=A0A8T0G168_ARGBR|nr:SEC14-like protein 3 like protein [Argiope bruennichi]